MEGISKNIIGERQGKGENQANASARNQQGIKRDYLGNPAGSIDQTRCGWWIQ
jgi:hypothetical protein